MSVEELVRAAEEMTEMYFGTDKESKLSELRSAALAALEEAGGVEGEGSLSKAAGLALKGRILNARDGYDAQAEAALASAVKLDPENIDAWNMLGEVYWKKKSYSEAKDCFEGALAVGDNPASLRKLSMVERQLGGTPSQVRANVASSVAHAKQATAMDVEQGASWYSLGNAYLTQFFTSSQDVADLAAALKAYTRAEKAGYETYPDLHFNRAHVYKYMLRYQEAYDGFNKAYELDPSWDAAQALAAELAADVDKVMKLIEEKAGLREKKIKASAESLTPLLTIRDRTKVTLAQCQIGPNPLGAVAVKVVGTVVRSNNIPQTLVVIDEQSKFFTVSIYNMQNGAISVGDEIWIADPFVCAVSLDTESTAADIAAAAKAAAAAELAAAQEAAAQGKGKEDADAPDADDDPDAAASSAAHIAGSVYTTIRVDKPNELWINGRSVEARGGIEAQSSLLFEAKDQA